MQRVKKKHAIFVLSNASKNYRLQNIYLIIFKSKSQAAQRHKTNIV